MNSDVVSSIDPECPEASAFLSRLNAELSADGLSGLHRHNVTMERLAPFTTNHVVTCRRCRAHAGTQTGGRSTKDNRSAIWGGATLGLIVGLVAGFFRENYWQTVIYALAIGGALGLGSVVVALIGNAVLRRKER